MLVGFSKDKKSLISIHNTENFKMLASIELEDDFELSCIKKITDTLFMVGGKEDIHIFQFDSNEGVIEAVGLNALGAGGVVQAIIGHRMHFFVVTLKGQVNCLKLALEKE